jgi:hypothetical protein
MFILELMSVPCIHVGRGSRLGPVTWFPLWTDAPAGPALATGTGASILVEEVAGHPQVDKLVIANPSASAVLLIEGELLEGGWQHRVLQHDFVLGPGRREIIDVSCVEQGRWHGGTNQVRRARRAAPRVRTAMTTASAEGRQSAVWSQVAEYQESFGASPTASLVDHIDTYQSGVRQDPDLVARLCRIKPLAAQRGIAYGTGGYPVGLEVFCSEEALGEHLEQILASLLLDAATLAPTTLTSGAEETVPGRRIRRLVGRLDELEPTTDPAVDGGNGMIRRADTDQLIVRGITLGDTWVHLSVFDRRHPLVRS